MEREVHETTKKMAKAMEEGLILSNPADTLKIYRPEPMVSIGEVKRQTLLEEAIAEAEKDASKSKGLKLPKWMRFGKESS